MAKKSALGKGLGSLLGDVDFTEEQVPDAVLPLNEIEVNPDQPRKEFDEGALQELTESIRRNGVLQPILVRKKGRGYEIVAGERRFKASQAAGLTEIPVLIRDISDDEVFQLALIENLQRSNLNPIEEAVGYRKLIDDKNLTQEQLAQMLSKSRSAVTNTLRLLDLPAEVQELIIDHRISPGHARAILAVPNEEGRIKLAEKVVAESLSVRQTENLAPLYSGVERPKAPRAVAPQSYKRAARTLRLALDTNVRVKQVRGKNKIEIEFKDEEDLARIIGMLSEEE